MNSKAPANPFPGLRPFEADEGHLFFGRERETDELLRRLRVTRFLLVAGSSGTGKSSLVRSGLIPALQSGSMLQAGSNWRIIICRPGDDPIENLAAAMDAPDALGIVGELASTNRVLLEATLHRSSLGIVQAVRQAHIPMQDNVLIVVDQFEELFRFRRGDRAKNAREEALAFFKLLFEASKQREVPIYIALTMRSDFLGDCIEFQGLPEAVNDGLYLIPRMTRDELRSAITGPIAVAGGAIEQRLVFRLLNDVGDDQDQLPVLQHALMRTWDHWTARGQNDSSIDLPDYLAVGGLESALSVHAEEAFQEASLEGYEQNAEKVFKALTDTYSDPRGVRRACSIAELAAICEAPEREIIHLVDIFRRSGRSFLTPHAGVPLESRTFVDLSHESLMRCWERLIAWTQEERESAGVYMRIAQAARWGGLWIDPQLETGLQWRLKNEPTAAWAERYDSNFALAMEFLDRSEQQRETERKKERTGKRNRLVAIWVLSVLFIATATFAFLYIRAAIQARNEGVTADLRLLMAENAVDESLSSASAQQSEEAPESPETEALRAQLEQKALVFYQTFANQEPNSEEAAFGMAIVHLRLGDINRLSSKFQDAVNEYKQAITQFQALSQKQHKNLAYQQNIGYCYNWLGETYRLWLQATPKPAEDTAANAQTAYNQAIAIQKQLHQDASSNQDYQQDLARSYYNFGILLFETQADPQTNYQQAIDLLTPLVGNGNSAAEHSSSGAEPPPEQELARVENNLGVYLYDKQMDDQAVQLHGEAIAIANELLKEDPNNYEYKWEAANYYYNLARALGDEHQLAEAKKDADNVRQLIEEIASPSQTVKDLRTNNDKLSAWIASEAKKTSSKPAPGK